MSQSDQQVFKTEIKIVILYPVGLTLKFIEYRLSIKKFKSPNIRSVLIDLRLAHGKGRIG